MVCATNRKLPERVDSGEFRQDLFYRINVFPLQPPPLRDRKDDVAPLAHHFLSRFGASSAVLAASGLKVLTSYSWPGNVRELANAMERAVILAGPEGKITAETLSFLMGGKDCERISSSYELPPEGVVLDELENKLVLQALERTQNNQTAAAKLLGLTRAKFRVLMKQAIS